MIAQIKKELGKDDVPVFATGGWGKTIAKRAPSIGTYDPYLTLDGIRLVAERGNGAAVLDDEGDDV